MTCKDPYRIQFLAPARTPEDRTCAPSPGSTHPTALALRIKGRYDGSGSEGQGKGQRGDRADEDEGRGRKQTANKRREDQQEMKHHVYLHRL